jgi:hypothetical protein
MHKHQEAESLISKTIAIIDENSFNFFRLQYYRFQNFSLNELYQNLPEVIVSVFNKRILKKYNIQFELWKIRQSIYILFIEAEIINSPNENILRPFKIGKFLNEVPIFSKEKRGMNISILVVQILFMLVRKNIMMS